MKLKKKLFVKLGAELIKAETEVFNFQLTIESLQNVCDHIWKVDESHGFTDDPAYCEICGKIQENTETRKDESYS